jgi:hypothetical protein
MANPRDAGARFDSTTIGWNEPLSLALSPLRGARELKERVFVVSRCSREAGAREVAAFFSVIMAQHNLSRPTNATNGLASGEGAVYAPRILGKEIV